MVGCGRVVEAQRRVALPIRPHLAPQPVQLGDGEPKLSERDPCVHYLSLGTGAAAPPAYAPGLASATAYAAESDPSLVWDLVPCSRPQPP
jgi:hypothetical protein